LFFITTAAGLMRALFGFICAAGLLGLVISGPAEAAREFPTDARPGMFHVIQAPAVRISRQNMMLAPGGQIRDESNLIVQAASLPDYYRVLYTLDTNGNVYRVWILTREERALYGPKWFERW
jgi:hypothetical protein